MYCNITLEVGVIDYIIIKKGVLLKIVFKNPDVSLDVHSA